MPARKRSLATVLAGALALALVPLGATAGAPCTDGNGTFRFLTAELPRGSTNTEYIARLVVANADGPVTFSIDGGGDPLNTGLEFDTASGLITGRPTVVETNDIVFCADDTVQQICSSPIELKINAAGGGGNAGAEFGTHTVGIDASAELLTMMHTARSRAAFAQGALLAAEWIRGRSGLYSMDDLAAEILDPLFESGDPA